MQNTTASRSPQNPGAWNNTAPYTAMLADYELAAQRLKQRIAELQPELKACVRAGTLESARAQTLLQARIQMLRNEYEDTQSVMQTLRGYAAREVQQ